MVGFREPYKYYVEQGGTLDYKTYRNLCTDYNKLVMRLMIETQSLLTIGGRIGILSIARIKRNYNANKTRNINWPESNKYRKEIEERGDVPYSKENPDGVKWFVYFNNEPDYCRVRWHRSISRLKNKSVYHFKPTFHVKKMLVAFLKEKPTNKHLFKLLKDDL